ncbi:MAG TPA: alpha/beta hydrolase-fold protein [Polyangiales bacterium]
MSRLWARVWLGLGGLGLLSALSPALLPSPAAGEPELVGNVQVVRFLVHGPSEREPAIAVWPRGKASSRSERLPLVIAFHGKGESKLGPERGYRAWVERYGLTRAYEALLGGLLVRDAFGGLVRDAELKAVNADLKARAFKGVFVVGVYTPDLLAEVEHPERIDAYAEWVAKKLVPKVQRMFPVVSDEPRSVGVDGVSLGGMVALEVGLRFPDVFSAVGSMQPAVRGRENELAERAARAQAQSSQSIRLLSSDKDPLLETTRKLSEALRTRRVPHSLKVTPGGHDYAFNQGPGAVELLYFHDRALRR